jgi:hypothetical protein
MKFVLSGILLLSGAALTDGARAAAWTVPRGHWQSFTSAIYSNASRSYDSSGNANWPETFQRILFTTDTEYGLTNRATLFVRTETAYVHVHDAVTPSTTAFDNAVEGGARWRIARGVLADYDVLSVEASGRKAGAFNFAYSADAHNGGEDAGFRLLYGRGFRLGKRAGFVDLQAGYRFLSAPRPDQTVIDLTAGLWLNRRWMVMTQSFNVVSSAAAPPYRFFRTHKVEGSMVWKMTPGLSLQAGAFFSPMGINALDERGVQISLWAEF